MSDFTIMTEKIAIGDPVMGLATYDINDVESGEYTLIKNALIPLEIDIEKEKIIDLDSQYFYVIDKSKEADFVNLFHKIGGECSYNMMTMEQKHEDIEKELGVSIGFFWTCDIVDESPQGRYFLDKKKIKKT